MRRHLVDVIVEEARIIDSGLFHQRLDSGSGGERRAWLVESDMAVGADAENLHVDAAGSRNCLVVGRSRLRDAFAVRKGRAFQRIAGNMHQSGIQSQRFNHRAMNRRMIGLWMVERNAEVFVQSKSAHVRDIHVLVFYDLRKRLIGGERA